MRGTYRYPKHEKQEQGCRRSPHVRLDLEVNVQICYGFWQRGYDSELTLGDFSILTVDSRRLPQTDGTGPKLSRFYGAGFLYSQCLAQDAVYQSVIAAVMVADMIIGKATVYEGTCTLNSDRFEIRLQ